MTPIAIELDAAGQPDMPVLDVDLRMAALREERLLRTATLAEGATHCDFPFGEPLRRRSSL